jgi:hypothetical protein
LKHHLGSSGPETADVETLRLEVAELRQKLETATEENRELKEKVSLALKCDDQTIWLWLN